MFSDEGFWPKALITLGILVLLVLFFRGRTYLRIHTEGQVAVGLFPLARRKFGVDKIVDVCPEVIPKEQRIRREWGGRGKMEDEDGQLFDCGSSTRSIVLYLTEGRIVKVGFGDDDGDVDEAAAKVREAVLSAQRRQESESRP